MDRNQIDGKRERFRKLSRAITLESVVNTMEKVPRESFVPSDSRHMAYLDIPLSIGEGQTISQPYIVPLTAQALEFSPSDRVLEIGTGSGYQTAILSMLTPKGRIVTMERLLTLAHKARGLLRELGYYNVVVKQAGTSLG